MIDLAGALAAPGGDSRLWVPAEVTAVDDTGARLTVTVEGASVVLRRAAGRYRVGDVVAVVRDPGRTGAGQFVAGVLSSPAPSWRWGTVTSVDGGAARLTVDVDGTSHVLPHVTGTYVATDQVLVLFDDVSGVGGVVIGKMGNPPSNPAAPATPDEVTTTTTRTVGPVVLRPTWSGTYRSVRGAWDRWNTGSYGGRSDCYQGNDTTGAGGPLTGLATFGDQFVNLGATSIESITVTLRSNGAGYSSSLTFTLQGSPNGSRPTGAPSSSGATVTSSSIARVGGRTTVALPASLCEELRTGSKKALTVVGSTYGGLFGTGKADGLAAAVTYTKAI